jgi:hypothetical protein
MGNTFGGLSVQGYDFNYVAETLAYDRGDNLVRKKRLYPLTSTCVYFTFHLRDTDNRIKSPHILHWNDAIARY